MTKINIKKSELNSIYKELAPFMGRDDRKCFVKGVCLHFDGKELYAIATNGYILNKIKLSNSVESKNKEFKFILPDTLIRRLHIFKITAFERKYKVNLDATISISKNNVVKITCDDITLSDELIDENYLDYERRMRSIEEKIGDYVGIAFNPKLLIDCSKALKDAGNKCCKLYIPKDPSSPIKIIGENSEVLLMPMRL